MLSVMRQEQDNFVWRCSNRKTMKQEKIRTEGTVVTVWLK
jgi:hypothetical protein